MKTIKFSMHNTCFGKPEKRKRKVDYNGKEKEITDLYIGNTYINLGYGWDNCEASLEEIFDLLTVEGGAIGPYLKDDSGGNRKIETFAECGLALVDIDKNKTIEEILDHPFYKEFGAGYYTSASHTEEDHRFRILHVLETPITDGKQMNAIYIGLMAAYGGADESCKDASRLFYGSVNAARKELTGRVLTDEKIQQLIEEHKEKPKPKPLPAIKMDDLEGVSKEIKTFLGRIRSKHGRLSCGDWVSVSYAVAHEVGVAEAKTLMMAFFPEEEAGEYDKLFKSYKRGVDNEATMGTLIYKSKN
jgi:hypothetical protein